MNLSCIFNFSSIIFILNLSFFSKIFLCKIFVYLQLIPRQKIVYSRYLPFSSFIISGIFINFSDCIKWYKEVGSRWWVVVGNDGFGAMVWGWRWLKEFMMFLIFDRARVKILSNNMKNSKNYFQIFTVDNFSCIWKTYEVFDSHVSSSISHTLFNYFLPWCAVLISYHRFSFLWVILFVLRRMKQVIDSSRRGQPLIITEMIKVIR